MKQMMPNALLALIGALIVSACGFGPPSDADSPKKNVGDSACETQDDCAEGFVCNYNSQCVEEYDAAREDAGAEETPGYSDDVATGDDDVVAADDESAAGNDDIVAIDDDSAPPENFPPGPYGTEVGDIMANHVFTDCDGNEVKLSDLYGKYKAYWFYAGGGSCLTTTAYINPVANRMYEAYADEGLMAMFIYAQSYDMISAPTLDECNMYKEGQHLEFPVVIDNNWETMGQYGSFGDGTPISIFLDSEFRIANKIFGWTDSYQASENEVAAIIEYLLEEAD
jgi:hypothetical protein